MSAPRPTTVPEHRNPYVGPRAFRVGETLYGRDREIEDLFDLLAARRIVLLYAPSGAGKSSLVQAGLIPRLRAEGFADLPIIRVNLARDAGAGARNRYLAGVIASLGAPARDPSGQQASSSFTDQLKEREQAVTGSPVLIFDQFEEIFTADPTDVDAKRAFFEAVGAALQDRNRWALFVMREEYVGALEPFARYVPTRLSATLRLDLLGVDAARDAIQKPAQTIIEDAAVSALLDDLRVVRVQQPDGSIAPRAGPYIEPSQLQVVCYRLWEQPRADPNRITVRDVATAAAGTGAVDAALAGYYADQVAALAAQFAIGERLIREWFDRRLITPQGVRALVLRETDAAPAAADGRIPDAVIRALVDAHLVRAEERRGTTWYELAHDRLIEPVRQDNRAWSGSHLNALQRGADVWNRQSRLAGLLLAGAELAEAEQWAAAHDRELTALDREYLRESREARDARAASLQRERERRELETAQRIAESERAARRRQTALSVALAVLALLALAAFGFSLWQTAEAATQRDNAQKASVEAQAQRDNAQKASVEAQVQRDAAQKSSAEAQAQRTLALARELAANASLQLDSDPELATLLALESLKLAYTPEADSVAWRAANQSHQRLLFRSNAPVDRALYSPDGKRVLSFGRKLIGQSGVASPIVWDAATGKRILELAGLRSDIADAVWSPDGRRIATAGFDGAAIIWDAATGRPSPRLGASPGKSSRVVWSRDGRRLATADDNIVHIWNATGGEALFQLPHKLEVLDMAWGPGDRLLATVGRDEVLRIWDPATGRLVRALSGHRDAVRHVAWNAPGNLIATGGLDGRVRIWNLDAQSPVAVLQGHSGSVTAMAWHPKINELVTVDEAGAVRIWYIPLGTVRRELTGHSGTVNAIAFSPDGTFLATGSDDLTARLWEYESGSEYITLSGHGGSIMSVMFSPDGQHLLTGGADETSRIWDIQQPAWLHFSLGRWLTSISWSADRDHIAVAGGDTAPFWNVATNTGERDFAGALSVQAVAFSPDGKLLAVGSGAVSGTEGDSPQGELVVWSPSNRKELWTTAHEGPVESVAWSPDGRRVVSGSVDETVRIWDAANGAERLRIKAGERVMAVAWSPDGRFVAGALDKAVQIWDAQNGRPVRSLDAGSSEPHQIAFSPDSRWILVPGDGRSARVFDVASGALRYEVSMDDKVQSVAWKPDGRQIATGGANGTVHLWDAQNGAPQRILIGHKLDILGIAYSPDGSRMATASGDGYVRFFLTNLDEVIAFANTRRTRDLTCAERTRYLHEKLTCRD